MAQKIVIFDTSVLCCLLEVPGKSEAGTKEDRWNKKRVSELIERELEDKSIFVLPLASIIETGDHIAQAPGDRFVVAKALAEIMALAARASSPWAAFTDQADLWGETQLCSLASSWPELAKTKISIVDATIKDVAEYYARAGFVVEIATGDAGLKSYEPASPVSIPRRRR